MEKQMRKEEFFEIITQQDQWVVCDLLSILGMTEEELTSNILEYKDELEVHVEGKYTPSGVLLSKFISFEIIEQKRNPRDILLYNQYDHQ